MSERLIKIGDQIRYRGGWGNDPEKVARVTALDVTDQPNEKYGESVEEVSVDLVRNDVVLFCLDDGHWCYSSQIDLNYIDSEEKVDLTYIDKHRHIAKGDSNYCALCHCHVSDSVHYALYENLNDPMWTDPEANR